MTHETLGSFYLRIGSDPDEKIPPLLFAENETNIRKEFIDSPTTGHILSTMAVLLMNNQDSGLWGAAFYGQQLLRKV